MAIALIHSDLTTIPDNVGVGDTFDSTGSNLTVMGSSAYDDPGGSTGETTNDYTNPFTELSVRIGDGTVVDYYAQLYYRNDAVVGAGDSNYLTIPSGNHTMVAAVFSGAGAFYQESGAGSTGGATTVQPGSITAPENGCLFVTMLTYYAADGQGSPSINSGFTIAQAASNTGEANGAIAYKIQGTAAAENPTWTFDDGYGDVVEIVTAMAVFRPEAGGNTSNFFQFMG